MPTFSGRLVAGALLTLLVSFLPTIVQAQSGSIRGQVVDAVTQEGLPGVNVVIDGTTKGAATDLDGNFVIEALPPATYTLRATFLGYEPQTKTDVVVQPSRPTFVLFRLRETAVELGDVVVRADLFPQVAEAPVSVQILGAEEIRRTPGGQNDLSRTLLSLPGVVGGVDNRNDILVRGGGPSENAYFVDGIEVPQINHFATQGASGGALGLLNVDFIRETEFFTGGFPVRYGDALSSVLVVENRPGSPDRLAGDFTVGAIETALTLDGPAGREANWLFSVRRSYLQFLFEALGLPIRPSYWDAQTRIEINPNPANRFTIVGIGAIDDFGIVQPDEDDFEANEIFERVLENNQLSYTVGGTWRRLMGSGFYTLALSRSYQQFDFADVDRDGVEVLSNLSTEIDNRLRLDGEMKLSPRVSLSAGGGTTLGQIDTRFFERARPGSTFDTDLRFSSDLAVWKSFAYAQVTTRKLRGRLTSNLGLRADHHSFIDDALALSPRASLTFALSPGVSINAAAGLFTQAPEYLALTVRDSTGRAVNRSLPFVRADQLVLGGAWQARPALRVSLEGFYKNYRDYPVSVSDPRVSLANLGAEYGYVGAEPLLGIGKGRAYGAELFAQRKLVDRFYFLGAYTLSWSEFAGSDDVLKPSSWDVRHSVSLTGGYRIGQRWEVGTKWRFLSGRPYTPFDLERSAAEYALTRRGVADLDRLNAERTPAYHRLDVRVDRRFAFRRWNAVVYLDLQNVYNRSNVFGFEYTEDPSEADRLRVNENVGLLPNFGFSIEF